MESKNNGANDKKFLAALIAIVGLIASVVTITGITLKDCVSACNNDIVVETEAENSDDNGIDATSVSFNVTEMSLKVGESYLIEPMVSPINASLASITWSSSDSSVASVDDNGLVIAHDVGTAIIVASTNVDGFTANCVVTVEDGVSDNDKSDETPDNGTTGNKTPDNKTPTSSTPDNSDKPDDKANNKPEDESKLSINRSNVTLNNGESFTLSISHPKMTTADLSSTKWKTSDSSAISVSGNGSSCTITAVGVSYGTTITATNKYGTVSATVLAYGPVITVDDPSVATSGDYQILDTWEEYRSLKRTRTMGQSEGASTFEHLELDGQVCYKTVDISDGDNVLYYHYFYYWNDWSDWSYGEWSTTCADQAGVTTSGSIPYQSQSEIAIETKTYYECRLTPYR